MATWGLNNYVSIIIVCHNEAGNLERTVRNLSRDLRQRAEIVVVDDQSDDGCSDFLFESPHRFPQTRVARSPSRLGVSNARNFGASLARGDILVFSDAHVEAEAGWLAPIIEVLSDPAVGAVAPAIAALDEPDSARGYGMQFSGPDLGVEWLGQADVEPYPIPLTCGCFVAVRRNVFDEVDGFDRGMLLYGSEDIEFSLHLWLRGYECRVVPAVTIAHRFSKTFRYKVDWEPLFNRLRMGLVHLGPERFAQLLEQNASDIYLDFVKERLSNSDVWNRRDEILNARAHNDDWYFDRFSEALDVSC